MRVFASIFVLIFYAVLLMPSVQYFIEPLPKKKLTGISKLKRFPELSFDSIKEGQFQKTFEKWLTRNNGLWGYLVRSENQINFSLFNLASKSYKSSLVLGKDNYLIQRQYLKDLNRQIPLTRETLETRLGKLAEVQSYLESKKKGLVVLISPNKASLHPEIIPKQYIIDSRKELPRNYDLFVELLEKNKINYLDGRRFFEERLDKFPYKVFARGGSHWNSHATCLISKELAKNIETKLAKKMRSFTCGPVNIKTKPHSSDRDLAYMANIWTPQITNGETPYARNEIIKDGSEFQPNALFVGTSFLWSVFKYFDRHKIYQTRDMYYYFNTNFRFPQRSKHSIDRRNLDWEKAVFSRDIIVLEINEATVFEFGSGFVEGAFDFLKNKKQI